MQTDEATTREAGGIAASYFAVGGLSDLGSRVGKGGRELTGGSILRDPRTREREHRGNDAEPALPIGAGLLERPPCRMVL